MSKLLWNILKFSPVVVAATLSAAGSALAGEVNGGVTSVNQLAQGQQSENIGQVTSVSQFSDVQPTDWAFQALQSLVERYGCIAGYPNGTYRGNRALTRYEFAAGLNACLDRVNELIATATADLVTKEDLAALQRLQEEFSAELATLRGRVDNLEARTAELEANQFSTTTKLVGEVIFNLSDSFGDAQAVRSSQLINNTAPRNADGSLAKRDLDSNLVFSDRVRLRLNSSFSGKDQLQIRLQARNTISNSGTTGTNMTRLSFDGDNGNDVVIDKLWYRFPLSDALSVKVDANSGEFYDNMPNFNPDLASDSRGSIGRYARFSPIYRQGSGGSGATINFAPKNGPISASIGYLAGGGGRNVGNDPTDKNGLTDGNFAAIAQLGFQPSKNIGLGLTYARTYQNSSVVGGGVNQFDSTGSDLVNRPFGNVPTTANHYGLQANIRASEKIAVGGWVGYADMEAQSGAGIAGKDATAFYWAANLGLRDLGAKGSLLGITFGQPPKVTGNRYKIGGVRQIDADTSYHLETLYRMQVSDNIAVTPGLLVIFNPEHNDQNDTVYVGTLRTTFSF
ncbi:iron uptake porin [Calothrix sp. UHCC 0171]|uniref:iron uptake porin n=1 Tax=Calothrix sp. UHCC 0171 TaxID=3110245 RepID=UPI002B2182A5|nr:iron uptake porin [Calothrix sp. UHCC 0171]MEA5574257.1 iron uptake porin [Calothrix sp. UHCC 0171]